MAAILIQPTFNNNLIILMNKERLNQLSSRRKFIGMAGAGIASLAAIPHISFASAGKLSKTERMKTFDAQNASTSWAAVSDRKIRVGIVGGGFGAGFYFHKHPNCIVEAVSDLRQDRREKLMLVYKCSKSYGSLEELVKDDKIEAVFVATDAPSHAQHCIEVLKHGKHVGSAVPAVYGSLQEAETLYKAVKQSGLKYMMFETSCFHKDLYAMRQLYKSNAFGKLVYSEGEYYHYAPKPFPSHKDWRIGIPPQWYPTHSNAYYIGVTDGSFTEVSCLGIPSVIDYLKPENNRYKNPFGTEIALFRTSEGGMSRMAVSWDTPGDHGEKGRIRGERGTFYGQYDGLEKALPNVELPPLPPGLEAGGHGGSHGPLTNEFLMSIIEDRKPLVDIAMALNMTVSGVVAHQSALKNGELIKIPQYKI